MNQKADGLPDRVGINSRPTLQGPRYRTLLDAVYIEILRRSSSDRLRMRPVRARAQQSCAPTNTGTGLKTGHYKYLRGEQLAQDVVDGLRVGLAAGGLHDLADEKFEDALVAGFVLGDVGRVFRDDFTGGLFDDRFADLLAEAFDGDDFGGRAAGFEHGSENFFGDGSGDFAGFDQIHQFCQGGGWDGAGGNFLAGIFQASKELGLYPVGGGFARGSGFDYGFEIVGEGLRAGEDFSVIGRDAIRSGEAGALGFGKFGEGAVDVVAPSVADVDGEKIGLREIAIVVGLFFRTHGDGVAFGLIPEARFLREAAAGFENAGVACDFVFERFLQETEGVEILYFDLGAEFFRAAQADADVSIAAERAFFHVAIANASVEEDLAERGEVGMGLFGRAHVGLGDDFGERGAAAVVIHIRLSGGLREAFVKVFCGVVFGMEARDADAFFGARRGGQAGDFAFEPAARGGPQFVMSDLISPWEVRGGVVFAGEAGMGRGRG